MATVINLTRVRLAVDVERVYSDSNQYYFNTGGSKRRYTVDMSPDRVVYLYIGTTRYANGSCLPANKVVDVKPEPAATTGDRITVKAGAAC